MLVMGNGNSSSDNGWWDDPRYESSCLSTGIRERKQRKMIVIVVTRHVRTYAICGVNNTMGTLIHYSDIFHG